MRIKAIITMLCIFYLLMSSSVMARSTSLKGICPSPLVIQLDWQPESEHGGIYELVGDGYKIDKDNKKVTGPLMASGENTGINVEVRIGGPPVGFQPAQALMYADSSIFMGFSRVTELISSYKDLPIVAVMATLDKSPFSIYWDAATYPDVNSIADLKKRNVTIMLGRPDIGWKYFIAKGIMNKSQMDLSDMAKPAAFISANGKLAEAGFATAEPFLYEVEIEEWGKPVKVQLLHDAGFPEYFQALAVKKEDIDKKAECLEKLVPIIQRSHVEYIQNPNETNKLIVKLADTYLTRWVYTMISAKFSHKQQLALDIVGNGENYFIGDFNPKRVERLMEIVGFVTDVDVSSLNPREMVTNKFLDPSIGL